MIKFFQYLSCIYMYILLINALIIDIGLQPTNPDKLVEHHGGGDSNVDPRTQGIYILFNQNYSYQTKYAKICTYRLYYLLVTE